MLYLGNVLSVSSNEENKGIKGIFSSSNGNLLKVANENWSATRFNLTNKLHVKRQTQ